MAGLEHGHLPDPQHRLVARVPGGLLAHGEVGEVRASFGRLLNEKLKGRKDMGGKDTRHLNLAMSSTKCSRPLGIARVLLYRRLPQSSHLMTHRLAAQHRAKFRCPRQS